MTKIGGYKVSGDGLKYDVGKVKKAPKAHKAHKAKKAHKAARHKKKR